MTDHAHTQGSLTDQPDHTDDEVVVIGAGFAGLSAAQVLGRAQRRVLLLGAGPTRNAEAAHAHNLLTRDGTAPGELLEVGMAEVSALPTVTVQPGWVWAIEQGGPGEGWLVHGNNEMPVRAAHVVVATGARDRLPEVAGLAELWGRRAHSCPFCDAAQYAGRRLLALVGEPVASRLHALLSGWTDDIVVADPGDITRLSESPDGVAVQTRDGREFLVDGVFVKTDPLPGLDLVADLELARRGPYLAVDGVGRTNLPGLWAAGDCAWKADEPIPGGQVVAAMASGARSASTIIIDLVGLEVPPPPPAEPPRTAERLWSTAHGHGPKVPDGVGLQDFWEQHYGTRGQIWSGQPNAGLVQAVDGLAPTTALDLGCGEGGDALWLAQQGWTVTGIDVSAVAIDRARTAAVDQQVKDRTRFEVADLSGHPIQGRYGLVVAAYLLSPVEIPREQILQAAAAAVEVGGTLVVLSHTGMPHQYDHGPGTRWATLDEQLQSLALGEAFAVVQAEEFTRTRRAPDGTVIRHTDSVIVARRV